jgi:hypothetical protein
MKIDPGTGLGGSGQAHGRSWFLQLNVLFLKEKNPGKGDGGERSGERIEYFLRSALAREEIAS